MLYLFSGICINGLLALGAYYKRALTGDGALMATLVGSLIWYKGGVIGFCLMGVFFVSASLLSRFKQTQRQALHLERLHDKSDRRDYTQVLANSLVPLLFLLAHSLSNNPMWYVGFVCAFAAANADTWASELGVLSKSKPRFILKGTPIPTGLSGGVTHLGLLASLMGAGLIAFSYFVLSLLESGSILSLGLTSLLILIGGFLGSIIDSLMGELFQVQYQSKNPLVGFTERAVDLNETQTRNAIVKGVPWIDNNAVNFLSVLLAASLTSLFYSWLF